MIGKTVVAYSMGDFARHGQTQGAQNRDLPLRALKEGRRRTQPDPKDPDGKALLVGLVILELTEERGRHEWDLPESGFAYEQSFGLSVRSFPARRLKPR